MNNHFHRQQGGTLLGLIIGFVAGLTIALIVAMVITKSSGPFNNKQDKSEKSPSSTAVQSADPNQPLYRNKDAVKEAAKEFAKEADIGKLIETTTTKNDSKPEEHISDKTAKPEGKETAASNKPEDKTPYFLQAGAYRNSTDADNMRARLALLGYEAGISEMISSSGTLYRVRIGPFTQTETMNRMRGKLKESGVNTDVARTPK